MSDKSDKYFLGFIPVSSLPKIMQEIIEHKIEITTSPSNNGEFFIKVTPEKNIAFSVDHEKQVLISNVKGTAYEIGTYDELLFLIFELAEDDATISFSTPFSDEFIRKKWLKREYFYRKNSEAFFKDKQKYYEKLNEKPEIDENESSVETSVSKNKNGVSDSLEPDF